MASGWIAEHLSPGERLGELLFGLIMTLSLTLGAVVVFGTGEGASNALLAATIGCNVVWSIIDASLFLLRTLFDRGRLVRLGHAIAEHPDEEGALAVVANELDETLVPVTSDEARIELYYDVVNCIKTAPRDRATLHRVDVLGAAAVFVTVFVASLPAAVPYLIIDDAGVALRASNALLIGMLFFVGYRWAGYTNINPWLAGTVSAAFGIMLVLVALAFGG